MNCKVKIDDAGIKLWVVSADGKEIKLLEKYIGGFVEVEVLGEFIPGEINDNS